MLIDTVDKDSMYFEYDTESCEDEMNRLKAFLKSPSFWVVITFLVAIVALVWGLDGKQVREFVEAWAQYIWPIR